MIKTINKNGYNLHIIKTSKFKTVSLKLIFWNELKEDELTLRNMLTDNLLFSSSKYKDSREMSIKRQELYFASIFPSVYRNGTHVVTEFSLTCIEDKYTEKGNLENSIDFLFDCLNNPNVKDQAFDRKSFNITKDHIKTALENEKDNPGYYSYRRYKELIGNKKILIGSILGTIEDLEKIDETNLYEYYNQFFSNNHIDIFVVGNVDENEIESIISRNMKFKSTLKEYKQLNTDYEKQFSEDIEQSSFKQSRLLMGSSIKNLTDKEKRYTAIIYNIILGNSPNSKLFKSVREKKSYAYSISSSMNRLDGLFVISAGISSKNYEDTKDEIFKQINEMKKGNFSKKEIKNAKELSLSILKEINDDPYSMIEHYNNYLYNGADTIANAIKAIKSITKEDIIKVANKINIDTIYMLKEDENE